MKTKFIYIILAATAMLFSCQKPELTEQEMQPVQGVEVGNEATISFTALVPGNPDTKAMTETPTDLVSMHLVIFDGNGMYVETREAMKGSAKTHDGHNYETTFEVTLTVTDQPRIIHFIANCPVEQILYGHEASIIGNMYTTKANYVEEDRTEHETAYWARVEVPYILVEETSVGSGKYRPIPGILGSFQCVPMLRNYAQVIVKDSENTTEFEYLGFTLYNTIDLGTVAPYNNTTQKFQNFVNSATGKPYKYPNLAYQGHALAAAELNTSLEMDSTSDDGYKWYSDTNPFYMYERKISVKTDEEEKWSESPPHVIIKGRYNGKINYYKVDLVYNVYGDATNPNQVTDIVYYNILRNFRYQFTISEVAGEGYDNVPDAINGSTSNNLSGSATTTKFTNISDEVGRIWVSYTDTTLVSNNQISLKYKYVPDLNKITVTNNDLVADGGAITLENLTGDVISDYEIADSDIVGGQWDGYREITFFINDPEDMTKEQTVVVRTDNANLTRDVRYYLKNKYLLEVECTPKVEARIGAPVEIDLKLPVGLTDDMFPLTLNIEVDKMSLSPDATQNTLPVEVGASIIPGNASAKTFHFVKTFETKEEYDILQTVGTQKILKTYWLTNVVNNEATVWVTNKYFNDASDNFVNAKSFAAASITPAQIAYGTGKSASISFTMAATDADYASRTMTVTLNGLTHPDAVTNADGTVTMSVKPSGSRVVTVNGFTTTTEDSDVSFTVEEETYAAMTATATRRGYAFTDLTLPDRILRGVGRKVNISFTMDAEDTDYANRVVEVSLDGLEDVNGDNVIYVTPKAGSRVVTIEGLLTTSDNGAVQFTVKTAGYDTANSARVTNRPRGTFTPVSYTYGGQTVTNIPTTGGEDVTFNFNLSDWEDGMAVNVVLDGLESADGSLETPATRAVSYVYYPQTSGNHSIKLKSTSGAKTCKVTLSADGFDTVEATLNQKDIKTYEGTLSVTVNNISIQHDKNNQNPTPTITIKSVNVNGADNISHSSVTNIKHSAQQLMGSKKYTLNSASFDIENMIISGSGLTDDTNITIVVTIKYGNTSKDYTVQTTLSSIK